MRNRGTGKHKYRESIAPEKQRVWEAEVLGNITNLLGKHSYGKEKEKKKNPKKSTEVRKTEVLGNIGTGEKMYLGTLVVSNRGTGKQIFWELKVLGIRGTRKHRYWKTGPSERRYWNYRQWDSGS